ncbi:MAG: YkgJ family cysteine cluster protein [bacterium]
MKTSEFKEKILKDYDRMKKTDKFGFACHPGVPCFNKCCNDVNIFLTPYDIIRLKNRLGITSSEFLAKYTILPIEENLKHPIVMFQMDDETLNCQLVGENGCTVYEDRPWSCRMFPVGIASPKDNTEQLEEEFYFLLEESVCEGFKDGKEWTIEEWMKDQGVEDYVELGELFKEISLHDKFLKGRIKEPIKLEMFYTVCYDIDKFRELVFNSSFFKRFIVTDEEQDNMKKDDVELLKFGFKFLKFSLFGEETLELSEDYKKAFDMKK